VGDFAADLYEMAADALARNARYPGLPRGRSAAEPVQGLGSNMTRLAARHPVVSAFIAAIAVLGLVLVALVETAANLFIVWS
jgi:hypothetical protein